jgi:hypothetical protein
MSGAEGVVSTADIHPRPRLAGNANGRYPEEALGVCCDDSGQRVRHRDAMQPTDRQAAFREAVLALNEEPTITNVRRYLAASRLLELDPARAPSRARRPSRPTKRRMIESNP